MFQNNVGYTNYAPFTSFDIPLYGESILNGKVSINNKEIPWGVRKIINFTEKCVGMLAEKEFNAEYTLLSTGVLIAPNVVLTTRHTVNSFDTMELCFIINSKKYDCLHLIEDGAAYGLDYILFYIVDHQCGLHDFLSLTLEPPIPHADFFCIGYEDEDDKLIAVSQINSISFGENLTASSYLSTTQGFSGGPYIDANGRVFGIHLKATANRSLANGEREGMLFSSVSQHIPKDSVFASIMNGLNGIFHLLVEQLKSAYINRPYDRSDSSCEDLLALTNNIRESEHQNKLGILKLIDSYYAPDKNYYYFNDLPNLLDSYNNNNYFFQNVSWAIGFLNEEEESKRTHLFGATPRLNSLTGNQVLLRYYIKGKTFFFGSQQEQNALKKFINSNLHIEFLKLRACSEITKHPQKVKLNQMKSILSNLDNWEVKITVENKAKVKTEQYIPLNQKSKHGKNAARKVADIDMGHKMGVVDFWMDGAKKWIKDERIPQKKANKTEYNKRSIETNKIKELEKKYSNYLYPARDRYGIIGNKDKRKQFMKEPWNYQFQFWSINQAEGRKKGHDINYDEPVNFKWQTSGKSSYRLVKR